MKPYNPTYGVPHLSYYLEEITQFGDFETKEERRILFTSRFKQDLIDLCRKNKWACYECNNGQSGWYDYEIKYKV